MKELIFSDVKLQNKLTTFYAFACYLTPQASDFHTLIGDVIRLKETGMYECTRSAAHIQTKLKEDKDTAEVARYIDDCCFPSALAWTYLKSNSIGAVLSVSSTWSSSAESYKIPSCLSIDKLLNTQRRMRSGHLTRWFNSQQGREWFLRDED